MDWQSGAKWNKRSEPICFEPYWPKKTTMGHRKNFWSLSSSNGLDGNTFVWFCFHFWVLFCPFSFLSPPLLCHYVVCLLASTACCSLLSLSFLSVRVFVCDLHVYAQLCHGAPSHLPHQPSWMLYNPLSKFYPKLVL